MSAGHGFRLYVIRDPETGRYMAPERWARHPLGGQWYVDAGLAREEAPDGCEIVEVRFSLRVVEGAPT